jgi:hypothetical protein
MIHKKQTYNIFVLRILSVWWCYKGLFDTFAKLRKATVSFLVSVLRPFVCNNLAPAGQSFVKMYVGEFYSSRSSKVQFGYNRTKITGTSHKDPRLFICGTTLVKSMTNTELQWLSWLPFFFLTRLPLFLGFCYSWTGQKLFAMRILAILLCSDWWRWCICLDSLLLTLF